MAFLLNINDFKEIENKEQKLNFSFPSTLTEEQWDKFSILQDLAKREINQEINILPRNGLINELPHRDKSFLLFLISDEGNIVAYGFSHNDIEDKTICYINTIYVEERYRGIGLSKIILNKLISENLKRANSIKFIKAITQHENSRAINLLLNNGFKQI